MVTVLTNARIYTSDEKRPWAEALAISGDTLVYVGPDDRREWGAFATGAAIYDLGGKMVVPGIIDSHIHPGMVSQSAWHIRLPWTEDPEELLAFVKDYAEKHPAEEAPFLYFEYYPTSMFGVDGPTKEMLDRAVSDRPCLCQDFGEHLHWVNSKMLELMGVGRDTPDPVPGLQIFVRDENGEPTGWVKEMAYTHFAENLYRNIGWTPPMEMTPERMEAFFRFLSEHGITAVADAITEGEPQMRSMYELDQRGKFNVYYDGIIRFESLDELPEKIAFLRELAKKYSTKHIKLNTMKLFLDGTNESGNSASLHPHENDPTGTNYGEILMEMDELKECFLICNREGLDMQIHMVGDRAFRVGCDAVEAAKKEAAASGEEWAMQVIFAHCESVDPEDMGRPAELGITVNWSCHWSGGYFGDTALNYFSREKWERMYQFNPIIDSGALVTFSSDVVTFYELHRADPFFSMQVACTRVDPEFPLDPEKYPGSMRPPESAKLSRENLIKGYTASGAKQLRWEGAIGSLEAGKKANLCVISDDFFAVPEERISDIKWEAVFFDGMLVAGELAPIGGK